MMGVRVFDTGNRTFDRYTVLIDLGDEFDYYTMSKNALAPDGFNQWGDRIKGDYREWECGGFELSEENVPEEVLRAIYLRQLGGE